MKDRTQPLPAPAGYKWHIRKSGYADLFFLQLWKEHLTIPEDGLSEMTGCEVEEFFEKETHVRRTSRHALRGLRDKLAAQERARRILALNGGLK